MHRMYNTTPCTLVAVVRQTKCTLRNSIISMIVRRMNVQVVSVVCFVVFNSILATTRISILRKETPIWIMSHTKIYLPASCMVIMITILCRIFAPEMGIINLLPWYLTSNRLDHVALIGNDHYLLCLLIPIIITNYTHIITNKSLLSISHLQQLVIGCSCTSKVLSQCPSKLVLDLLYGNGRVEPNNTILKSLLVLSL